MHTEFYAKLTATYNDTPKLHKIIIKYLTCR